MREKQDNTVYREHFASEFVRIDVMMTVSACFQNSDTSVNFLLATSKKSCLFALANDVWWLNEHILPAPAPISIHSSSVNGTAEVILAIALQIETGL